MLWHHTAAKSSPTNPAPALNTVINGRSDLQGPLCHALVDYNGVFHLVSANRANHAGAARASGPIPAGDGNTMLIGWEIDYDGVNQHMTPAQYTESLKATAAVLHQLGHDASYARGHRETSTTGKIDPSFIDLDVMRADNTIRHWWQAGTGNPVLDDWGTTGRVMSNPSGFAYGGQQHLFYRNPDGNLEHKFWDQGTDQITTGVWAGGPFVGNPFAFVHKDQQHIFARDAAGALKHWYWVPGSSPANDNWGITSGVASDPTGFSTGSQHHIFFRNTDGQLQHRFSDDPSGQILGDTWSGGPFVGNPHAFTHRDQQHVFARKENGDLLHFYWSPTVDPPANDNWGAVGVVEGDPVGLSTSDGHHVFYRTANGSLEHKVYLDTPGQLITDNWGGTLAP